jgi:FkbM family methyltransferase
MDTTAIIRQKGLGTLGTLTRKATTLFSLAHSAVLVSQDGIKWRSMMHTERLKYLTFQPALSFKPQIVVYDIGANVGEFAMFVSKAPSVSKVYCFEPVPQAFGKLIQNTKDVKGVRCFNIALGNSAGTRKMYANHSSPSSSVLPMCPVHAEEFPSTDRALEIDVQMMDLEGIVRQYNLSPPDFIKMDVQGFEDRVINGGIDIIKKAGYCMLELSLLKLYEDSALVTDINVLMRTLGFRLVGIVHNVVGKSGEILQIDGLYKNEQIPGLAVCHSHTHM